MGIDFLTRF